MQWRVEKLYKTKLIMLIYATKHDQLLQYQQTRFSCPYPKVIDWVSQGGSQSGSDWVTPHKELFTLEKWEVKLKTKNFLYDVIGFMRPKSKANMFPQPGSLKYPWYTLLSLRDMPIEFLLLRAMSEHILAINSLTPARALRWSMNIYGEYVKALWEL